MAEVGVGCLQRQYKAALACMLLQNFDASIVAPYLKTRSIITSPDVTCTPLLLTHNYSEVSEIKFAKRFIRPEMIVFDIGAHIGYYSVLFADMVENGSGHVHCFEPTPSTFRRLQDNIYINRFSHETVSLHNVGLHKRNVELEFQVYDPKLYSGLNTFGKRAVKLDGKEICPETRSMQCITLDDFAREENLERADFIKIDVEGFELNVFEGGRQFLKSSSKSDLFVIMAEVSDKTLEDSGASSKELFNFIELLGLEIGEYDMCTGEVRQHNTKDFYVNSNLLFCKSIAAVNKHLFMAS